MPDTTDTSVFSDGLSDGLSLRPDAKPWARFWARTLDLNFGAFGWGLVMGIVLGIVAPEVLESPLFSGTAGNVFFGLMLVPFVLLTDAVSTALFGNTLGKLIAGIKIEPTGGGKLAMGAALQRNALLYVFGLALGIPLVNLAAYSMAYNKVSEGAKTEWDKKVKSRVVENGANLGRTIITAVLVVVFNVASTALNALG